MSNLYKEAIIESQKIRELAEESAKKKLLDDLAPAIKKSIDEQLNEVTENFFVEDVLDGMEPEENVTNELPISAEPVTSSPELSDAASIPPETMDAASMSGPSDVNVTAPLTVKSDDSLMGATMPGQDGKIVVDFEDLFSGGKPLQLNEPSISVTPVVPVDAAKPDTMLTLGDNVPQLPTKENYQHSLKNTISKINEAFYFENISLATKDELQNNLFELLEKLDYLKENNIFNAKEITKNENKLNFLFTKLKEAKISNIYIKDDYDQGLKDMSTLKEYAARLFKEEADLSKEKLNKESTASDEHAMKQSGVSPEVGSAKDLKAASAKQNAKVPAEKPWDEGEATVKEGAEGFGDTSEKPAVCFDVSEAELKEAIKSLVKPKDGAWEEAEPAEEDPSHKNLKEDAGDELDILSGAGGDEEVADDLETEPDLVLNIELPDAIEDALANLDLSQLDDVGVEVAAVNVGKDEAPSADLAVADDVDLDLGDEGEEADADDLEAPADDMGEEEMKESYMEMKEAFVKLLKQKKLFEAKACELEKELSKVKELASKDRESLKEANLFLAKNVYFTKFMQRGDVSKKTLVKIVEHLDRAQTVTDAKNIYVKIKAKLAESANAPRKLAGSPSKVTLPGSVTLNENVNHTASSDEEDSVGTAIDTSRWRILANIKK